MILSGLWQLVEVLSFGIEEPEEKSYIKRLSMFEVRKQLWTGRDGQERTEKATTVLSAVQYKFFSSNEQSYFSSVAGTWQLFSEFLKKKQNCSTIWDTHLSFPFPRTYTHYVTLPVEYSNICTQSFPAEMRKDSFTITRMESAVLCPNHLTHYWFKGREIRNGIRILHRQNVVAVTQSGIWPMHDDLRPWSS